MPTSYFRAPNPFWNLFYPNGNIQGGAFATDGQVTFYRDVQRDEKKAVYADPGGITPLENPLRLADLGRLGPNVYWADDELYYIEIRYPNGTTEAIEGFPNFGGSGGGGGSVVGLDPENQLLNGQFRFNFGDVTTLTADELTIADYWTFKKNNTSATDTLKFERFNLGDNTVEATPIFRVRYTCTGQGTGETEKDFKQIISDVRTFEQTAMTFSFTAFSDTARTVEVLFVQHFGTGGNPSADVSTVIGSISLTAGVIDKKSVAGFIPPSASGKTLGTNGDDYVAIVIRMPFDATCDIWFTNVYLDVGDKVLTYPRLTKEKEDTELLGAMIPTIGDDDRGKAITANRNRKYSLVMPVPVGCPIPYLGDVSPDEDEWVLARGQTVNVAQNEARYSRLHNVIGFKGGHGFDSWLAVNRDAEVTIAYTVAQSITLPANGSVSPGFTFSQLAAGNPALNLFRVNRIVDSTAIYIQCYTNGLATAILNDGGALLANDTRFSGNARRPKFDQAFFKAASAMAPGSYFRVHTPSANYAVYYTIDGAGSPPSLPGYINLGVAVANFNIAEEVMLRTLPALGGYQVDNIICVAATSIPAGAYFTLNTHNNGNHYVWFTVGGAGVDPKPAGLTGIKIALASSDTAAQVAEKVANAIASFFFQIPDMQGAALRGYDPTETIDFDHFLRTFNGPGSIQYDQVMTHTHNFNYNTKAEEDIVTGGGVIPAWRGDATTSGTTAGNLDFNNGGALPAGQGGYETRMYNMATNFIIKL